MYPKSTELPPLTQIIKKGSTIRIYIADCTYAGTTSYTAGIATGEFDTDGIPFVLPYDPQKTMYDFYLPQSKIKFSKTADKPKIIIRSFPKAGYQLK